MNVVVEKYGASQISDGLKSPQSVLNEGASG